MRSRPCLIGLTGLPGSGKTSLAGFMGEAGAVIISADDAGHEVLDEQPVQRLIGHAFGPGVVGAGGSVDRRALGSKLVRGADVETLNQLVHPRLLARLADRVRKTVDSSGVGVVAVDAALIPEWGIDKFFDLVIFVVAPAEERYRRLAEAGRDLRLMRLLEAGQFDEAEKRGHAHILVDNTADIGHLRESGEALCRAIVHRPREEETSWRRRLWTG